jgi:hypothetical protein
LSSSSLRIIVTGLIAEYPLGGMTWHYLQYVLGLRRLGHDVYYIEHSGNWPYNPVDQAVVGYCDYNVDYLARVMARYGFADRWAYFFEVESRWFGGMSDQRRADVVASADLLINVSGSVGRPADYRSAKRLVYVDTDPVFAQLKLARRDPHFTPRVDAHDVHFTFGERVAETMPDTGHRWLPTRQPVVLSEWQDGPATPEPSRLTTIMNWTSYRSETWQGRTYGQKDEEFRRFLDLPGRFPELQFEIAGAPGTSHPTPRTMLESHGWRFVNPMAHCYDADSYRSYIQGSWGEWSVAKNGYVAGRSAWFSERSACYLAAGRPVIVQDTGFTNVLPVGHGICSFQSFDETVAALAKLKHEYPLHASAAVQIAKTFFDSDIVLTSLIGRTMET